MPLVAAKCTQCSANIEVDDTHEAGVYKYCETAFITEKAIFICYNTLYNRHYNKVNKKNNQFNVIV